MEKRITFKSKTINIFIGLVLSLLLIFFFKIIFNNILPSSRFPEIHKIDVTFEDFISICILPPLIEEMIFRYLPIEILRRLLKFDEIKWHIVTLIAIGFGLLHGSMINIFVQGVAGFFFGWVYIKNGFSYWSSVTLHFLYNFTVVILIPNII